MPFSRRTRGQCEQPLRQAQGDIELTQRELADAIHVPYPRISDIVNQRRGVISSSVRILRYATGIVSLVVLW